VTVLLQPDASRPTVASAAQRILDVMVFNIKKS
jgi:hypothetical protein